MKITPKIKKPNASTSTVKIEVMLNGVTLAKTSVRAKLFRCVTIGHNAMIHLPAFGSGIPHILGEFAGGRFFLHAKSLAWAGYLKSRTKFFMFPLKSGVCPEKIELNLGDYASLRYDDHLILIKHVMAPKKTEPKPLRGYMSPIWSFLLSGPKQGMALGMGLLVSAFLIMSFILWAKSQERDKTPSLEERYVLPFLSTDFLDLYPEQLKQKFKDKQVIGQIHAYAREIIRMNYRDEAQAPQLFLPSTLKKWQEKREQQLLDLKTAVQELQKRAEDIPLEHKSFLVIPAVIADSLDASAIKILQLLQKQKMAVDLVTKLKQRMAARFNIDPIYDYANAKKEKTPDLDEDKESDFCALKKDNCNTKESQLLSGYKEKVFVAKHQFGLKNEAHKHKWQTTSVGFDPALRDVFPQWQLEELGLSAKVLALTADEYGKPPPASPPPPPPKDLWGYMSRSAVNAVIKKNRFQLQICFELALRRNDASRGAMEWKWRISPRGTVDDISLISTTISDPKMIECIQKRMASWKFPAPKGGPVQVMYPFEFFKGKG